MRRIALIKDGMVYGIAVWDGEAVWNPGKDFLQIDVSDLVIGGPSPGWNYDQETGEFSENPAQEEQPLSSEEEKIISLQKDLENLKSVLEGKGVISVGEADAIAIEPT